MIKNILSRTDADAKNVFRDVCYEWEDEAAKLFNVPIRKIIVTHNPFKPEGTLTSQLSLLKRIGIKASQITRRFILTRKPLYQNIHKPVSLCFIMFVPESPICVGNNTLPVFLDVSPKEISWLGTITQNVRLFYVTSRDIFNALKAQFPNSNVHYMPLSVSDKYYSQHFAAYRNKKIEVIQMGRRNPVLHEYMLRYTETHKNIDYVYSDNGSNVNNQYISTLRGNIGAVINRKDFIDLVASSKVSLLGCTGMDIDRENIFKVHFPTPRFYESAVLGCALIGRYPENQEFTELNMKRYCPNITSYEQFVKELERALAISPEELYAQNHEFIINSLTSKRIEQIKNDLKALTCTNF